MVPLALMRRGLTLVLIPSNEKMFASQSGTELFIFTSYLCENRRHLGDAPPDSASKRFSYLNYTQVNKEKIISKPSKKPSLLFVFYLCYNKKDLKNSV